MLQINSCDADLKCGNRQIHLERDIAVKKHKIVIHSDKEKNNLSIEESSKKIADFFNI